MEHLPTIYAAAVLLPLASFAIILLFARQLGPFAAWIATSAILGAGLLSFVAFGLWLNNHFPQPVHHAASHDEHGEAGDKEQGTGDGGHKTGSTTGRSVGGLAPYLVALVQEPTTGGEAHAAPSPAASSEHHDAPRPVYSDEYYTLGVFGPLRVTISYYIDTLTVVMFCMVTFIATCIHFYAIGYMHDELSDVTDKEVTLSSGEPLHRPGRFPRFFQYLSLFCFSMLGLVLSGNIAMVFVFWELVGICSYFLIGFYVERKSASNAANKAFIVNRVGDFGMIVGLMVLWSTLGTFSFGDTKTADNDGIETTEPGIFSLVRPPHNGHRLTTPVGMVREGVAPRVQEIRAALFPDLSPRFYYKSQDEQFREILRWRSERSAWTDDGREPSTWAQRNHEWIDANREWLVELKQSAQVPDVHQDLSKWLEATKVQDRDERVRPEEDWRPANIRRVSRQVSTAVAQKFKKDLPLLAAGTAPGDKTRYGYGLLVLAGLGIFCGCVGKSAQFPLHVWLPDAMEGPTPVSALVHSATMVAAGVYLVGRFFPAFAPEVLLVIAIIGTITMLLGASIAFAANDIKRVLAYSTVSQLGLMMLALGVGGWLPGLMHLITHAFFKSLLFMCSGSVIHAVHTNDLRKMGGLFNKMPVTAITMLIGCLAIAGVSVPFVVGFSGYYSKDAILEQALSFGQSNHAPPALVFFVLAVVGAAMTTCYMFRMWFMTFVGQPRDRHAYEHAHESPPVMYLTLIVLAVMAVSVAWTYQHIGYFAIAAAFFVVRALQKGWFKYLRPSHGHEHEDVEHERPGHYQTGDHADAGHVFPSHHHEEHAAVLHGARPSPAEPPISWTWLAVMLLFTLIGGRLFYWWIGPTSRDGMSLQALLEQARPLGTLTPMAGAWTAWTWPNEHAAHVESIVVPATLLATASWVGGILLAAAFFWWGALRPDDVRRQFAPIYNALVNKWWFDELYDALFVQPTMVISRLIAAFDKRWIDGFLDGLARVCVWFSKTWDLVADRTLVDGSVNLFAAWMYSLGLSLRGIQTGRIRQYVLFIVVGSAAIFVLIIFFWSPTLAR
jgi:NADH:ubiquinone oxidoreductase subunit 5 (subunit L)/multisubunit Na+/H+ antiporter MnhA subunit